LKGHCLSNSRTNIEVIQKMVINLWHIYDSHINRYSCICLDFPRSCLFPFLIRLYCLSLSSILISLYRSIRTITFIAWLFLYNSRILIIFQYFPFFRMCPWLWSASDNLCGPHYTNIVEWRGHNELGMKSLLLFLSGLYVVLTHQQSARDTYELHTIE
jgi:hypothetical protein